MIALIDQAPVSFKTFIDWYPATSEQRYELMRGVIVPMAKPQGKHSRNMKSSSFEAAIASAQLLSRSYS